MGRETVKMEPFDDAAFSTEERRAKDLERHPDVEDGELTDVRKKETGTDGGDGKASGTQQKASEVVPFHLRRCFRRRSERRESRWMMAMWLMHGPQGGVRR